MEKKYGVYICKGCGIGDSIDIEKLAKSAKSGTVVISAIGTRKYYLDRGFERGELYLVKTL